MSEILSFDLYSVLKNEDAPPYADKRLVVVADGLGGSGSSVHRIDRNKHPDLLREIKDAAFGDFDSDIGEKISDYLASLLEAMADDAPDTSALWASRVVIGRFVYAVLRGKYPISCEENRDTEKDTRLDFSDESHREALTDFILLGLTRLARHFSLESGGYNGQLLLPTTLAAICIEERESTVTADCIWAGDSRCYALLDGGLRILSKDDEDETGSITNLFYVGREKAILRHRRYEISKPCVLMTASDGIFDPFDNDYMIVEHLLLDSISSADSARAAAKTLKAKYKSIGGDDATVALSAVGFDSYEAMREHLKVRTEYVYQLFSRWQEDRGALEVLDIPESEVRDYVASRTADKYSQILPILKKAITEDTEDAMVNSELRERVASARAAAEKKLEEDLNEKRRLILARAIETLSLEPARVREIIVCNPFAPRTEEARRYAELVARADEYQELIADLKRIEERQKCLSDEQTAIVEQIDKERKYCYQAITERASAPISDCNDGDWIFLLKRQTFWCEVEHAVLHGTKMVSFKAFVNSRKNLSALRLKKSNRLSLSHDLLGRAISYTSKKAAADSEEYKIHQRYNDCYRRYTELLDSVFDAMHTVKCPEECLTETFVASVLPEAAELFSPVVKDAETDTALDSLFALEKQTIVGEIVNALAANYDVSSEAEGLYNPTRLLRFREYYRCRALPDSAVVKLREEIAKMEEEHYSMLRCNEE